MKKEIINSYIINFRRLFSPYTKPDVSIKITVYPYSDGAIIIMELNYNSSNNTEFKSESTSMAEAMSKTNLFDETNDAMSIHTTRIFSQNNKIIIIKGEEEDLWTNKSAQNDIDNFLTSLKKRKDGQD